MNFFSVESSYNASYEFSFIGSMVRREKLTSNFSLRVPLLLAPFRSRIKIEMTVSLSNTIHKMTKTTTRFRSMNLIAEMFVVFFAVFFRVKFSIRTKYTMRECVQCTRASSFSLTHFSPHKTHNTNPNRSYANKYTILAKLAGTSHRVVSTYDVQIEWSKIVTQYIYLNEPNGVCSTRKKIKKKMKKNQKDDIDSKALK